MVLGYYNDTYSLVFVDGFRLLQQHRQFSVSVCCFRRKQDLTVVCLLMVSDYNNDT